MTLEEVVYRMVSDADFAAEMQREPRATLAAAGLTLDEPELAALQAVLHRPAQWTELCARSEAGPMPPWWDASFSLQSP